VSLAAELERVAALARRHGDGDALVAVLATEPVEGERRYLCAFEREGARSWLLVDDGGAPVTNAGAVRESVAIAALCELAEESAFPGDLDELRAQLVALRVAENPPGIDEAEGAALALQHAVGVPPAVASPARLDGIGHAARRLERALDPAVASPFGEAMQSAQAVVEELLREVEAGYRLPLQVP
jgi:hypothetical protein